MVACSDVGSQEPTGADGLTQGARGTTTRWAIPSRIGGDEQQQLGADTLLLAQLLWNRGIRSQGEAAAFLDPVEQGSLADPRCMRGVPEAIHRLRRAITEHERIAIYGDYDVDGLAGAALLADAL